MHEVDMLYCAHGLSLKPTRQVPVTRDHRPRDQGKQTREIKIGERNVYNDNTLTLAAL